MIFKYLLGILFSLSFFFPINEIIAKTANGSQFNQSFFLENKGQMKDMNNNPIPFVLFKTEAPGMNVYITEKGLTYLFIKSIENAHEELTQNQKPSSVETSEGETSWHRVDMILKNANIKRENCIKEGASESFSQYFFAHCKLGITDVRAYEKITIKEIYPGIDWVVYNSNERGFKYDFIIHPNANPNQIQLLYEGSGRLEVLNNQIHFENPIGEVDEGKLFCYQGSENNEVKSNYIINKNIELAVGSQTSGIRHLSSDIFSYEIQIQLNNYDKTKELTIDPQLTWSTFYGGTDLDGPTCLTTDPFGNVYTSGYLETTNFPVTNPGGTTYYQGTITSAATDIFVMKFNNNGVLQWATYYGGTGIDQSNSICSDAAGNIFLTGFTYSSDFPTLTHGGAAYLQTIPGFAGGQDAFILKFSNNGTRLWSTYYGGFGNELGNSICTDPSGNIIIGGQTFAGNTPVFAPAGAGAYYQPAISSASDAFILRFDNVGVQQWGTYFGGSDIDIGASVCTDASGNIFFTGSTRSNDFPILNAGGLSYFLAKVGTNYDVFIAKFSSALVLQWSTFYGGTAIDEGKSICTDAAGNIFVTGGTTSNAFPTLNPGGGAFFQAAFGGGNNDAFILKFDNIGTRLWATYYGGTDEEQFNSEKTIVVDSCQNVYLAINTESTTMPVKASCATGHYYDNSHNGGRDVFISKFSNGGVQQWGTFFGGSGNDYRQAIDVDFNGSLFVGGEWTQQNGFNINAATYPLMNPGGSAYYDPSFNVSADPLGNDDGFIAKFKSTTVSSSATSTNAVCICNGTATANATGGCTNYQYDWFNSTWTQIGNTQIVSNLCAGTYHVIVRDSSSCSAPDTSTVTITMTGGTVNISQNISICNGSSYTLPGGGIVNTAGAYIDTIPLGSGCDSIITTNVTIINAFTIAQTISICTGNSYTLPGGASVNTAGVYVDTLTSIGGCDSIITTTVSLIQSTTNSQSATICTGNNYTLPGGNVVNTAGVYIDTLTSINGCDSIINTTLTVVAALTSSQSVSICSGNNYTLPGGTQVNTAGVYNDTLTSIGGCDSIITTTLTLIAAVTSSQTPSICTGNTFTLPDASIVNTSGTYIDTVTAQNGCDSIITTTLTVNALPTAAPGAPLQLSCTTTSGTISATSSTTGATFSWTGPGIVSGGTTNSPTVNAIGTYTVTVTDPLTGCTNTSTVVVTNNTPLPNVSGTGIILPCNPQTGTINASSTTPNVTYSWTGPGIVSGGNTNNPTVNSSGTYTVTVLDPLTGCTNTSTVIVTNAPNPTATVSVNVTIPLGSSTTLTAGGGNNYSWFPTTNLTPTTGNTVTASPSETTTYCVEVTDNNGCKDTACVTVSVEIPCPTNENLQLPNAFSPNADGSNDEFCLQGWDVCIENFSIVIFDRWGEKVFESKDPNFCWDGTFRNTIMDAQVFVYYIKARFLNLDKPVVKKGNISLIR